MFYFVSGNIKRGVRNDAFSILRPQITLFVVMCHFSFTEHAEHHFVSLLLKNSQTWSAGIWFLELEVSFQHMYTTFTRHFQRASTHSLQVNVFTSAYRCCTRTVFRHARRWLEHCRRPLYFQSPCFWSKYTPKHLYSSTFTLTSWTLDYFHQCPNPYVDFAFN